MNNDQLCLSICKRLKNTCRMYIHDTKSIYRRYKEYLQTMQKVLPTIQKKYLQTIQKVFANDTKSICKRYKKYLQTIRGTYQKRRQSEIGSLRTQPPASWKVSFLVCGTSFCLFSRVFCGTSLCLFSSFVFLQPWN